MPQRALILGAAGRDFHNFNTYFRDNALYDVIAFTATQIPDIEGRTYPAELAGPRYPNGIPIEAEDDFERLIRDLDIDVVVFAYSDVTHEQVMHLASRAIAAGADYMLLGAKHTMVKSVKPLVAVCAARTGSGKSQTSRRVAEILTAQGKKVVVIRDRSRPRYSSQTSPPRSISPSWAQVVSVTAAVWSPRLRSEPPELPWERDFC